MGTHQQEKRIVKKRIVGAAVVATAVLAAGGGWVAGRSISSPMQAAARTAAPAASAILVPVEERLLTSDVVTRGTARFGSPQKLTVTASSLKTNAGTVSDIAVPGAVLDEGAVALTASGRPLFVLVGRRPLSRDLGPGMTGDDVLQLETALARLGFDPGPVDGLYDQGTEAGVSALYAKAGFAAFTATDDQLAQVRAREAELATTRNDNLSAAANVDAAAAAVSSAQAALDDATARVALAPAAVERARAHAETQNRSAAADVSAARAALAAVRAAVQPPATAAELAAADRDLTVALAAADAARLTGEREIADAEASVAGAQRDVFAQSAAVDAARSAQGTAAAALTSRSQLSTLAEQEADLARRRAGVQVPADELVFVATGPVRVSESLLGKGDPVLGVAMQVTDAVVSVDAGLALSDIGLVKAGMAVRIEEPDLGISAEGVVKQLAPGPGTNGVDGFHVYFETSVAAPPPNLVGASVRLTIAVESSGGPVLAVPVSALSLAPDGTSRLQRQRAPAPRGSSPSFPGCRPTATSP